ncbi:MAG: hypothetical protein ACRD1T_14625, partial [Acidimicrobiia bacterium]
LKLMVEYLHEVHYLAFTIDRWLSLSVIVIIFAISFWYARAYERKRARHMVEEKAAELVKELE